MNRKIILFVLMCLAVTVCVYIWRHEVLRYTYALFGTCDNISAYAIMDRFEGSDLLIAQSNEYMLVNGLSGEWDETMREIGNIVFDPTSKKYFLYYTGHMGTQNPSRDVYIGAAESFDGLHWVKKGKVMEEPAEDPYVVYSRGTYFMYFEDKSEIPFNNISLATSTDGIHFSVSKKDVLLPEAEGWQNSDVSSPVIIWDEIHDQWVMLYEGRGEGNLGAVGYATSSDLISWVKTEEPVISKKENILSMWFTPDNYFVPDDILRESDGVYTLTLHELGYQHMWQSVLATSTDLRNWNLAGAPISRFDALMFNLYRKSIYLYDGKGIAYYVPGTNTEYSGSIYCMSQFEEVLRNR